MILPFGQSAGKLCEIEISEKSLRLTASPEWKCSRAAVLAWTGWLHLSSKMMYLCSSIITPLPRSITLKTSSATPAVLIFAPAFTLALAFRASDSLSFPLLLPGYYLIRMFSFKQARNVIGDRGLEVVANHCKKLKRIRVEPGEEEDVDVEQDLVSQIGLSTIAQSCLDLEFVAVYVSDITNSALETAEFCKNLRDFLLVLLDKSEQVADLPLDNGVMALAWMSQVEQICILREAWRIDRYRAWLYWEVWHKYKEDATRICWRKRPGHSSTFTWMLKIREA